MIIDQNHQNIFGKKCQIKTKREKYHKTFIANNWWAVEAELVYGSIGESKIAILRGISILAAIKSGCEFGVCMRTRLTRTNTA